MTKKHFTINDMHCGACATGIQMCLSETDGICEITVDYNAKRGEIEFDENQISIEQIQDVIKDLGYTASPVS